MTTFREATAEDAGLISHIHATSWRRAYRGLIAGDYLDRLPDGYWVPSVRAWLSSGQLYGLLLLEDGKPVGACLYGRGRDEAYGDWGEIVSLYLLPEVTRRGLGGQLIGEALRRLREDGYERFYLWALEGNCAADAFYRKHGFRATEDRVSFQIGGEDVADVRYTYIPEQAKA